MKLRFIVISVFIEQHLRRAEVSPEDENISRSVVDDLLDSFGMNPRFHIRTKIDPMWYLILEEQPIGYVRVFDDERGARNWFEGLRDKTNVWAYWHNGYPLPLIKGANAKDANQFVAWMAMLRVRAFTAHGAAKSGWQGWSSGRSTAIDSYVSSDRKSPPPQNEAHGRVAHTGRDTMLANLTSDQNAVSATKPSVRCSKWNIQGTKLIRTFDFSGLPPPERTAYLRIECDVHEDLYTGVRFCLRPYLYLVPGGTPFKNNLVKAPFAVGLVAAGSGAGTEASPLVQGGVVEVDGYSYELEPDTAFLMVISDADVASCLRVFSSGKEMTFTILDYKAEIPVKLRLRLPNDREFQRLHSRLLTMVAASPP